MVKFVLYTKTYSGDFNRLTKLLTSIKEYNRDNIPYYISCPHNEKTLLIDTIGKEGYTFIPDEELWQFKYLLDGWRQQQIVKSHLWKAIDIENYLSIDSDQYFIRDFYYSDFIHPSGTVYSLIYENKENQQYEKLLFNRDYQKTGYAKAVRAYRNVFNQKPYNKIYDFGPPPYSWCSLVWKNFEENYLIPNNLTFETFQILMEQEYKIAMREAVTYGEYLLASKTIDIYPTSGYFKFYNSKEMYEFENQNKLSQIKNLKENYLGVTFQSKLF